MSLVLDLIQALSVNTSTNDVTATNTPALGDNTKKLATMEALQAGVRNKRILNNAGSPYTLAYADHGHILVDASAGNVVINLPAATTAVAYKFRRIDTTSNTVTINRAGTDTIEGAATASLTGKYASRDLIADGTATWYSSLIYDQGVFTPTARGTGTTGTFTYTAQGGNFQRIGNRVHFALNIGWSASTGTGSLRITLGNIPYPPVSATQVAVATRVDGLVTGSARVLQAYLTATNSELVLEAMDPTGSGTSDVSVDSVTGQLMFSGSYICA